MYLLGLIFVNLGPVYASALPTTLNLSSNTTNSSNGNFSLYWSYGGGGGSSSSFSVKSNVLNVENSTLIKMPPPQGSIKAFGPGGTTTSLYENGFKVTTVNETGSYSFTGKTNGAYDYYVKTCSFSGCLNSNHVSVTVALENNVPTITNISNKTINEDSNTGSIPFTINDVETSANLLSLSKASSNTTLIPNGNIIFGGSGSNRTIRVTPVADKFGSSTITVTVFDGNKSSSDSFLVTVNSVNDAPTITNIPNQIINEDGNIDNIPFSIHDVDSSLHSLSVSMMSSNTSLIPIENIINNFKFIAIRPAANQFGSSNITITVSDGNKSSSRSFMVTVNSVNDVPTITNISNKTINEDSNTGNIGFNIGDVETSTSFLTLSKASSNSALVPTGNIVFGGSGANRTIKVTPLANKYGSATITVSVSDGELTKSNTFVLTVNPVNDAPIIVEGVIHNIQTAEDTAVSFILTGSDVDSSTLTWSLFSNPSHGSTIVSGTGTSKSLIYTPSTNYNGTDSFEVEVTDGILTDVIKINVNVSAVNDVPVIAEGSTYTISVLQNSAIMFELFATDLESSSLSWSEISAPAQGTISMMASDGGSTFTYTNLYNGNAADSFKVKVTDEDGGEDSITVNVNLIVEPFESTGDNNRTLASITDASYSANTLQQSDVMALVPGTVSVQGGVASYNIPIQLPPGRRGGFLPAWFPRAGS